MTEYLLTFASLTRAQTGLKLLRGRRIAVQLRRTPKAAAVHGCGYALAMPEASLWRRCGGGARPTGSCSGSCRTAGWRRSWRDLS